MKLHTLTLLPYALLILLLTACGKEEINENQTVFFQYEHENYAWIYTRFGWFIDKEGQIRGYNLTTEWKSTDNLGYIDADSLLANYNQADTLLMSIDVDEFIKKTRLIEGTLDEDLSELKCPGADGGIYSLHCYYWDNEKGKYKKQLLSQIGDCNQINKTSDSKKLIAYLGQFIN